MLSRLKITKNFGSIKIIIVQKRKKKAQAMFGSLLETEDEAEYERDTSVKILQQTSMPELRWKTRICGLKNQGATCYFNFLLQTLFCAPEFPSKYIFCTLC